MKEHSTIYRETRLRIMPQPGFWRIRSRRKALGRESRKNADTTGIRCIHSSLSRKIGLPLSSERKMVAKETPQGCLSFSITAFSACPKGF